MAAVAQSPPLLIALGATPGALAVMVYAILNGFLPYLLSHVSILQLLFTSGVVAFVLMAGIALGISSLLWLFILPTLRLGWRRRFVRIVPQSPLHPFLPDGLAERLAWLLGSASMFLLIVLAVVTNALGHQDHSFLSLVCYFLMVALFQLGLIRLHGPGRRIRWALLLAIVPLSVLPLFIVPQSVAPLLDQVMVTMGFRSSGNELVLIDDDAERLLEQRAGLYGGAPDNCPVQLGDRRMWYLPRGVVIWRGPGDSVLVGSGQAGSGIVFLRPDQLLTSTRAGALICCPSTDLPQAGPTACSR